MRQWIFHAGVLFCATVFIVLALVNADFSSKPVIIIHGILDSAVDLKDLKSNIQKARPGTAIHVIDLYDGYSSLTPLWKQVEGVRSTTNSIMKTSKDGVTLIGFSQGGLVARGLIQTMDDHNVDTFISLASPLNGQYGDTSYLKRYFPNTVKKLLYKIFYSWVGQRWSVANYWRDPHNLKLYRMYSSFLAQLNNETESYAKSIFQHSWKTNFMKLKKLVLVGGPDDGVITPWRSSFFGCYDDKESVMAMRELAIYRHDSFGLRTLDKANSLVECVVPGVEHVKWHGNATVFHKCIAPFL